MAWEIYEDLPMPSQTDEDWRRTDYRSIHWNEADQIIEANGAKLDSVPAANLEPLVGEGEGGTMVFVVRRTEFKNGSGEAVAALEQSIVHRETERVAS